VQTALFLYTIATGTNFDTLHFVTQNLKFSHLPTIVVVTIKTFHTVSVGKFTAYLLKEVYMPVCSGT
jgi:hypothetical protein